MTSPWLEIVRARKNSGKPWLILPKSGSRDAHELLSFADLASLCERAMRGLRRLSGERAPRVLLIVENSAECAVSVFAALAAGITVVPWAPPSLAAPGASWRAALAQRIAAVNPALVVGQPLHIAHLNAEGDPPSCSVAQLLDHPFTGDSGGAPPCAPHALWQSTSGTTRDAKLVMLSHDNILANLEAIGRRVGVSPDDVGASWLPLHHDMGLVGALLFCTYWGIPLVFMKPLAFAMRPESWLRAIDRYRVTCSPAPSFAYELCATRIRAERLANLDLSSWRVAFNGAEQVHHATVRRFCERFAYAGFRPEAFYPVYGLAEHTVAAALPVQGGGLEVDWVDGEVLMTQRKAAMVAPGAVGARALVSVGSPLPGHELRICDAQGRELGPREVGEIQVAGPSRMVGYHNQIAEGGRWLRTGDLGYLSSGRLFVVGREKHVIKRAGSSIDAAAVEEGVRLVERLRARTIAVFGVWDPARGSEKLVIQVESTRLGAGESQQLRREAAEAVRAATGVSADEICFVPLGSIPQTTSGKVRVESARARYAEASDV